MNYDIEAFLFIDALGWDLVQRERFLEDLLPERRPVEMQFGYSCAAIPTILSGRRPDEHGHMTLFRFAPNDSPFKPLRRLEPFLRPKSFWSRGRVRHWLSKFVKRLYGYTGYFQLYQMPFSKLGLMDYCEKRDLFAPEGLAPFENLADLLLRSGIRHHISDWRRSDEFNLRAGCEAIAGGARFLFLYTAELDGLLHQHVLHPEIVHKKLEWYRRNIEALLSAAKSSGRACRLTVFSDHGMTPLTRTVDVRSAIEKTGLVFGKDYGACYDSTMFRVTCLRPDARERIEEAMKKFSDCGRWLSDDEERRYGIHREDRMFGDAIFLMNPGVQIVPSDMGSHALNGMHGFAPEDRDSEAAILSNAPIPVFVNRVADYFELMKMRLEELAKRP